VLLLTAPPVVNSERLAAELGAAGITNRWPYVVGTDLCFGLSAEADRVVIQAVLTAHTGAPTTAQASATARTTKIAGAKARARQIAALSQTPGARTSTAWTQVQRVAILDAIGDLALMLSWLADDLLNAVEAPD